jgi:protein-disulfide isomerase
MRLSPLTQELAKEIEDEFKDVPYPGDDAMLSSPSAPEGRRYRADFLGRHWREVIDPEFLQQHATLRVLSVAARRFYLPAPVSTVRGSDKAPITILVFSDFESFPCARSASVIDGLLQQTRDVRVIFKHAPAASNPNALLAHEAALAAGAQGKFWEMHDTLFENQTKLTRADLLGYAKSLGLDLAAFQRALDNHTYRPIVERDLAEAAGLGVTTTPTFFVNGRRLVGPQGYASLGAVIESLLAGIPPDKRVREESSPPAPRSRSTSPTPPRAAPPPRPSA